MSMRLTDKEHKLILPELHNFIEAKNQSNYVNQKTVEALDKLGQLEDFEEKLGIDLFVFFRMILQATKLVELSGTLDDGLFITHPDSCLSIDIQGKCVRDGRQKFLFKDYGKKWALTKEEFICD